MWLTWIGLALALVITANAVRLNNKARQNLRDTAALRESAKRALARQLSEHPGIAYTEQRGYELGRCSHRGFRLAGGAFDDNRCGLAEGHPGEHMRFGDAALRTGQWWTHE